MPSTKDIKRRQKSVANTRQVTKAVGMVAAAKMRRSQAIALQSRPYAQKAIEILAHIKQRQPDIRNLFLDGFPASKKILALVVTSDKGLCGSLNSAVIRESQKLFEYYKKDGYALELVLSGIKSKSYFERMKLPILEVFRGIGDYVELEQVKPIADFIQEKYKTSQYSKVIAIYTEFISTLKQRVQQSQILPIPTPSLTHPPGPLSYSKRGGAREDVLNSTPSPKVREGVRGKSYGSGEYLFEPSPQAVLDTLVPQLLDIHIYHIILESNASEHSARMVAMKNATDNAQRILGELTLSYNKARQAAITKEITEIVAGVEAIR